MARVRAAPRTVEDLQTRCDRAALQAIREPSGEVWDAGADVRDDDYVVVGVVAKKVWQAMIDVALEEG